MGAPLARMQVYVDALPQGLDSYPECVQKASIYREFLVGIDCEALRPELPPTLRAMIDAPAPVTAWVPEVHASALFLAMSDTFADDTAFVDHVYRGNRRLLDSPLYRLLFRVLGPRTILRGARSRWGLFHRGGVEMVLDLPSDNDAKHAALTLEYPPRVIAPLLALSYAGAFRAAAELSGAQDVSVRVQTHGSEHVTYALSWT
ncbi:MAG: hypothetical protein HOO96_37480 [Polyangiaceae bacterium]|nr:hypothetical protein [Polyangiaceae bacterium]